MHRVASWFSASVAVGCSILTAGCPATVGSACDESAAYDVAYNSEGEPAYVGQAIMIASCGGSSYCHTQTDGVPRFGAPADLVFDPVLTDSGDSEDGEATQRRLLHAWRETLSHRDAVYASVVTSTMPPAGRGTVPDLRQAAAAYRTYSGASDTEGTPLPGVLTTEGRELLRNWLACGAPVVGRSRAEAPEVACTTNADCPVSGVCLSTGVCDPVGDFVERRSTGTLEPTWDSLFTNVFQPTCAVSGCHAGASAFNGLDFSDSATAYTLVTTGTATSGCGGASYVIAGDSASSYLLDKMSSSPSCGATMPPTGALSSTTLDVIAAWIDAGAAN